jgi:hypothetical protein
MIRLREGGASGEWNGRRDSLLLSLGLRRAERSFMATRADGPGHFCAIRHFYSNPVIAMGKMLPLHRRLSGRGGKQLSTFGASDMFQGKGFLARLDLR